MVLLQYQQNMERYLKYNKKTYQNMAECSDLNKTWYFQVSLPGTFGPKLFYFELNYTRGYFRLKLNPTSRCCPQWPIFFKNLFYQNNCKDAMNIGGGQIRGALFDFFVVKKCSFCIFQMLPSVSKITPVNPLPIYKFLS